MDIVEWWEELLALASEEYGDQITCIVQRQRTFYLEYYYAGLTPTEAMEEEWG